jgi:hypothetical protein
MREWMFAVVPAALVAYFVAYPDDFTKVVGWLTSFLY